MRLIISDMDSLPKLPEEDVLIGKKEGIRSCVGCFGCWIKTPGQCVIKDGFEHMGRLMSQCDQMILVSECIYGSVSPFIKNVLDRGISYMHPNFVIRNGEMHHKRRYDNVIHLSAYFYGEDITEEEKETARGLIQANSVNYDGVVEKVTFFNSQEEIGGALL